MMIPNNYNILVYKTSEKFPQGRFYLRMELPDVAYKEVALERLQELREIFPEEYGLKLYHTTCYTEEVEEV